MSDRPRIYVLAGVNGGGKSSIGGAAFRESGADYYNPDEVARELMAVRPGLTPATRSRACFLRQRGMGSKSMKADPEAEELPSPRLVLHLEAGRIVGPENLSQTPDWAKPIVAAALQLIRG